MLFRFVFVRRLAADLLALELFSTGSADRTRSMISVAHKGVGVLVPALMFPTIVSWDWCFRLEPGKIPGPTRRLTLSMLTSRPLSRRPFDDAGGISFPLSLCLCIYPSVFLSLSVSVFSNPSLATYTEYHRNQIPAPVRKAAHGKQPARKEGLQAGRVACPEPPGTQGIFPMNTLI